MPVPYLSWRRKSASFGQRLWNNSFTPPDETGECEFDQVTRRMGLTTENAMQESTVLRSWAKKHRNVKYVPDALLRYWGLEVDEDALTFTL